MFTNVQRQVERTGRSGTPRDKYLQDLVSQFQNATDEESKEKIAANLANFAYDPFNYAFMRQLNVLELFLDCITEPNERLIEFGIGGICNSCVDPANALVIVQCGGIPLIIQCLSSPVRNTVSISEASKRRFCSLGGYISDGFVLFSTLCSCLQFSSRGYITGDLCTWGFVLSMQPCDKERDPET